MIKISNKYSIKADEYNFVVVKLGVNKKTGEPTESAVAYVNDVQHALQSIYSRETKAWVKEHDATLRETVKAFQKIAKEITDFGKQFNFDEAANASDEPTPKPKRTRSKKA